MSRPRVAILLSDETRHTVLNESARALLAEIADITAPNESVDSWNLPQLLEGAVACLTGRETPRLTAEILDQCADLQLVAHTAGTIRNIVSPELVGTRVHVCQAAAAIADAVAEMVVLQILSSLRSLPTMDRALRDGASWQELTEAVPGRLLGACTVGVVGASRTGRAVIKLLRAFGSRTLVVDPFLSKENARELGVELVNLDDLLVESDVVTLHAPLLPETTGLIGREQLGRMRDGTILVNSARPRLVDLDALKEELRSGRIYAALDVFPDEPLARDSEWRSLPNTVLTPHLAGHTVDTHFRQGGAMVAEVGRFLRGEPLQYEVTAELAGVIA